jgi:hypothetical protein
MVERLAFRTTTGSGRPDLLEKVLVLVQLPGRLQPAAVTRTKGTASRSLTPTSHAEVCVARRVAVNLQRALRTARSSRDRLRTKECYLVHPLLTTPVRSPPRPGRIRVRGPPRWTGRLPLVAVPVLYPCPLPGTLLATSCHVGSPVEVAARSGGMGVLPLVQRRWKLRGWDSNPQPTD